LEVLYRGNCLGFFVRDNSDFYRWMSGGLVLTLTILSPIFRGF
jgi:hypothetical protein